MLLRDLSDAFAWIKRIIRRLDRIEGGAMLENASITAGRLRFIGGLLRVDSGGRVEIVGTLQVDGESTVTGQFTVEGPWSLTGDGEITGDVTISGTIALTGDMTVTGEITVDGAGRIRIGGMTLDPSANGGSIDFGGGRFLHASGGNLGMYAPFGFFVINSSGPSMVNDNGVGLHAGETGPRLSGVPTTSGVAPNAYIDAGGNVHRVI